MTVDALCHHFFWSPLKIIKAIYRLNLHHGLPINPLAQDHQVPVTQRLTAYLLKFLIAHGVLASVLSGTTPLPTFFCSGDDTAFEKCCSFSCSSAEELVLSFNGPLDHGSW